jgi:hypothetical protein
MASISFSHEIPWFHLAIENHNSATLRQLNIRTIMLRTTLSSSLQTLGEQTKPIPVPPQELHDVASTASENEDMSGERLLVEHGLHLSTQTIEAATHVGYAGGQPYLRSAAKIDHLRKLSRIDLSNAGSAPRSTLIMALPGNSI